MRKKKRVLSPIKKLPKGKMEINVASRYKQPKKIYIPEDSIQNV